MGTHPIFESDFDCLTEMSLAQDGESQLMKFKTILRDLEQGQNK